VKLRSQVPKIALFALTVLLCSGCSGVGDGKTTIKPTSMSSFSPDPNAEDGTRNNPISIGKSVVVNDWKVQVLSVNRDALKVVRAADPYSGSPASNERYVLLKVKATYIGEESSEPSSDLRFKIVGSKGNTFSKSCGYSADTFSNNGETFPDATVEGSLCFTVDSNQITDATLSVQGDYSAEDRKFLSLDSN
jgi:hypothetical protein